MEKTSSEIALDIEEIPTGLEWHAGEYIFLNIWPPCKNIYNRLC